MFFSLLLFPAFPFPFPRDFLPLPLIVVGGICRAPAMFARAKWRRRSGVAGSGYVLLRLLLALMHERKGKEGKGKGD